MWFATKRFVLRQVELIKNRLDLHSRRHEEHHALIMELWDECVFLKKRIESIEVSSTQDGHKIVPIHKHTVTSPSGKTKPPKK